MRAEGPDLVLVDGGLASLVALRIASMEWSRRLGGRGTRGGQTGEEGPVVGRGVVGLFAGSEGWVEGERLDERRLASRSLAAAREAAALCGCRLIEIGAWVGEAGRANEPSGVMQTGCWPGVAKLNHSTDVEWPRGNAMSRLLLEAQRLAREEGCSAVVWPVQVPPERGAEQRATGGRMASGAGVGGGDQVRADATWARSLERIAAALDRAMLLTQLSVVDADDEGATEGSGIEIRTPLVDLRDEQVVELALDLDLPLRAMARGDVEPACWWCERGADEPPAHPMGCGVCPACERWFSAWRKVDGLVSLPAVPGQSVTQVVVGKTGFTSEAQRAPR